MEESVKSSPRLEVSVSFGRFENDALSWEKWSAFSPNKYLEEVGTLSTPGSVAQKKAYFEAHYKKIAARKAEQLEQEKLVNRVILSPDVSSKDDHVENSSEVDAKNCPSDGERLVEEVAEEACINALENASIADDETKDDNRRSSEGPEEGAFADGSIDATASEEENEEAKNKLNGNIVEPELIVREEAVMVGLEDKPSKKIMEKPPERKNGIEPPSAKKKENPKLNTRNIAQKVTPTKKERNLVGTKKKVVSPATKPLQASTPRHSKPAASSTPTSASQSLKKKANGSPLPKSKNFVVGESKRAPPTSLHMSLNFDSVNPVAKLPMTRKSLIMEQMGDKDIVKRAFKTFQNRTNVSFNDEKPSTVKHVSSTPSEPKISSLRTPTKGNVGPRKDAEKMATQRSQLGTRSNPLPTGSHRSSPMDRKSTMASSPAVGARSDEKRKEFLKKLEAKSIARESENTRASAKSKDEKESRMEKLRQSLNFRAKPKSSYQ